MHARTHTHRHFVIALPVKESSFFKLQAKVSRWEHWKTKALLTTSKPSICREGVVVKILSAVVTLLLRMAAACCGSATSSVDGSVSGWRRVWSELNTGCYNYICVCMCIPITQSHTRLDKWIHRLIVILFKLTYRFSVCNSHFLSPRVKVQLLCHKRKLARCALIG